MSGSAQSARALEMAPAGLAHVVQLAAMVPVVLAQAAWALAAPVLLALRSEAGS